MLVTGRRLPNDFSLTESGDRRKIKKNSVIARSRFIVFGVYWRTDHTSQTSQISQASQTPQTSNTCWWISPMLSHSFRVVLNGRLADGGLIQNPFGPKRTHMGPHGPIMGPHGPAKAQPGTQYAKPFRKFTFLLGPFFNPPCINLPSGSTRTCQVFRYI